MRIRKGVLIIQMNFQFVNLYPRNVERTILEQNGCLPLDNERLNSQMSLINIGDSHYLLQNTQ